MCFALAEMQALLKELLTTVPPTRLANLPGMRTLIESLLPYSERHKARMEKLIRSSYLLDYTLREIKIASAVDGAAPSTAAVAHLAPAPVAHLAPPAAPGPRFRRADIDGPARPAGDAGMEDGTEFETLELDEEIEEKAKDVKEKDEQELGQDEDPAQRRSRQNIRGAQEFQNRTRKKQRRVQ